MSKIAFVIEAAGISGGANVVFQHCIEMQRAGHEVSIVSTEDVLIEDFNWHPVKSYIQIGAITLSHISVSGSHYDVCIATWWKTVFSLWKISAARYAYFVQSIESRFYERDDYRQAVEATYELSLHVVTISPWIANYLMDVHGVTAAVVRNGINKICSTARLNP